MSQLICLYLFIYYKHSCCSIFFFVYLCFDILTESKAQLGDSLKL